jgi:hypothetical protein
MWEERGHFVCSACIADTLGLQRAGVELVDFLTLKYIVGGSVSVCLALERYILVKFGRLQATF